jgi:2-polyprenyl-6-methoxyphenol hydroxylase-like FAD-dependent oxidoreductase
VNIPANDPRRRPVATPETSHERQGGMRGRYDFAIAGGGIGGLAAALALSRRGFTVAVLERADDFGEIGAGIQLGPNAFTALDALGVGARVRTAAVHIDRLVLMDSLSG